MEKKGLYVVSQHDTPQSVSKPPKKKIKGKINWVYLVVLLILLLFFISIWFNSKDTVRTVSLERQTISIELPVEVVFIRDEDIIRSPGRGRISFGDINEGERVRVNQQLATINARTLEGNLSQTPVITGISGVISFQTDGFEGLLLGMQNGDLNLVEVKNKDFDQYKDYKNEGDFVETGAPVFRIINPFSDVNFILYFPKDYVIKHGFELSELMNRPLRLRSNDDEYRINTAYMRLSEEGIFCSGIIFDRRENFFNIRKDRFTLSIIGPEGYLVSRQAIVYDGEEPRVFIQTRNSYDWVKVDILRNLSDKVLIMFEEADFPIVINPQVL